MRSYVRIFLYLTVALVFSSARAGSYDDWFRAIKQDDAAEIVALLRRGFDANTVDPKGIHGLYSALQIGSLQVAGVLVEWPATRIDWRSRQDESPLMMACLKGQLELAVKLVRRGADVNKPGWTPLHYAASGGHVAIVQMLLDEFAFIDAQSPNGTTPLMMAAFYGTPQTVKLLLDAGADTAMKNELGLTAVDFARRANREDVARMITAVAQANTLRRR